MKATLPRFAIIAASLTIGSTLAHAQGFNQIGGGNQPAATAKPVEAPPALPGASSTTASAVPSNRPATDLEPNDALFDAINRGDIAAARDAISRGAELNARNVLGMTPMELSVDLGRNDISFMLLSMRGADNPRNQRAPNNTAEQALTKTGKQAARQTARTPKAAPVATQSAPPTARLFANDGGAPNPSAGFLGFGGR
jgi:hypothetical protein